MWVGKSRGTVLILCGTVGIATASGCSDTVDTGPGDGGSGASGQGGSSGSAGSSGASGAGRGGSAGSAGSDGSTTGGTSGTGDGGIIFRCTPVVDEDPCVECVQQNCCTELEACGRDPDCSSGNEYGCILRCVRSAVADGGVAGDDTFGQCAGACVASSGSIKDITSDLIACLRFGDHVDAASGTDCLVECTEPADAR
jgi:hypothetical protein